MSSAGRRFFIIALRIGFFVALGFVGLVFFGQASMIYFPRPYGSYHAARMSEVEKITYETASSGKQTAFLLAPPSGTEVKAVWWLFGGNGSLALDWMAQVRGLENEGIAFLLVDYPSYGLCEGKPKPSTIRESIANLHDVISKKLDWSPADLTARSSTLGHSLGSAIALDTAAEFGMKRVIAVSPFTTMQEMVKLRMGSLISPLLTHRYNNLRSMERLDQAGDVNISIFHGTSDGLIPSAMGQHLAEEFSAIADFTPVNGAGHNDVLRPIAQTLRKLLLRGKE